MSAYEWLDASVRPGVNLEVRLLVEAFITVRHAALIPLPGLDDLDFWWWWWWWSWCNDDW